ncbi:MAG: hypothetical protein MRY83_08160 [Flavobacteriales bacterium]|nr:hypothetical protein [Flavobacteriales bacterium]
MPTYGILIIFNLDTYLNYRTDFTSKLLIALPVFINTFLIPSIMIVILYLLKIVKSLKLEDSQDRFFPYTIAVSAYFATYYILSQYQMPQIITSFIVYSGITIIVTLLINLKWKISAHMIGIGGLLGAMFVVSDFLNVQVVNWFCLITLVAGLIGYSRLNLKAHTTNQVGFGFILGFGMQLLTFVKLF